MNIFLLVVLLAMLGVIFFVLLHKIVSPALEKRFYWEVAIKITVPLVLLGALYHLLTLVRDCSKDAVLIAVFITILFLLIVLIWKEVRAKVKALKGERK